MNTKSVMAAVAAGLLTAALSAAPAAAEPPIGGAGAHTHHVHTGDGGCIDIDSVAFNPDHRGLHQGANSSGPDAGPWHGTCASHQH
ncbi:hypothetical protein [Kribbella sp. HUAS MG21]|uniref:Secreted protein n=1 Tax=Kribbella sp. HUAS MG21 TaxID=3160966 RepID=A0AAU7TJF0_9ACTN